MAKKLKPIKYSSDEVNNILNVDLVASDVNSPINKEDYEEYTGPVSTNELLDKESNLEKKRAQGQGALEQSKNSLIQIAGGAVGTTVQDVGALFNLNSSSSNLLMDMGKDITDSVREYAPIYRENPNQSFNISDFGWWADNFANVGQEAAGFALTGAGVAKGVSLLGRAARANKVLNAAVLSSKYGSKVAGMSELAATSAITAHVENMRQSVDVMQRTYEDVALKFRNQDEYNEFLKGDVAKEMMEQGLQVTEGTAAEYISAKAGHETYKLGRVKMLTNLPEAMLLMRVPGIRSVGSKLKGRAKIEHMKQIGKPMSKGEVFSQRFFTGASGLSNALAEGTEEMLDYIAEKEGEAKGQNLLGENVGSFGERLSGYFSSEEFWEQGFIGGLTGLGFKGIQSIKSRKATSPELSHIQNRPKIINQYVQTMSDIENGQGDYKGITEEEKSYHIASIKSDAAFDLGIESAESGMFDYMKEYVNSDAFKQTMEESNSQYDPKAYEKLMEDFDLVENSIKTAEKYLESAPIKPEHKHLFLRSLSKNRYESKKNDTFKRDIQDKTNRLMDSMREEGLSLPFDARQYVKEKAAYDLLNNGEIENYFKSDVLRAKTEKLRLQSELDNVLKETRTLNEEGKIKSEDLSESVDNYKRYLEPLIRLNKEGIIRDFHGRTLSKDFDDFSKRNTQESLEEYLNYHSEFNIEQDRIFESDAVANVEEAFNETQQPQEENVDGPFSMNPEMEGVNPVEFEKSIARAISPPSRTNVAGGSRRSTKTRDFDAAITNTKGPEEVNRDVGNEDGSVTERQGKYPKSNEQLKTELDNLPNDHRLLQKVKAGDDVVIKKDSDTSYGVYLSEDGVVSSKPITNLTTDFTGSRKSMIRGKKVNDSILEYFNNNPSVEQIQTKIIDVGPTNYFRLQNLPSDKFSALKDLQKNNPDFLRDGKLQFGIVQYKNKVNKVITNNKAYDTEFTSRNKLDGNKEGVVILLDNSDIAQRGLWMGFSDIPQSTASSFINQLELSQDKQSYLDNVVKKVFDLDSNLYSNRREKDNFIGKKDNNRIFDIAIRDSQIVYKVGDIKNRNYKEVSKQEFFDALEEMNFKIDPESLNKDSDLINEINKALQSDYANYNDFLVDNVLFSDISSELPLNGHQLRLAKPEEIQSKKTKFQRSKYTTEEAREITKKKVIRMQNIFNEKGIDVRIRMADSLQEGVSARIDYEQGSPVITIGRAYSDTVFHEFGHLFIDLLGPNNSLVQKAVKQVKGTDLYNDIKRLYPELSGTELDFEVLATALGMESNEIFESSESGTIWERLRDLIIEAIRKIFPNLTFNNVKELARQMVWDDFGTISTYDSMLSEIEKSGFQQKHKSFLQKEYPKYEYRDLEASIADIKTKFDDTSKLAQGQGQTNVSKNLRAIKSQLQDLATKDTALKLINTANNRVALEFGKLEKLESAVKAGMIDKIDLSNLRESKMFLESYQEVAKLDTSDIVESNESITYQKDGKDVTVKLKPLLDRKQADIGAKVSKGLYLYEKVIKAYAAKTMYERSSKPDKTYEEFANLVEETNDVSGKLESLFTSLADSPDAAASYIHSLLSESKTRTTQFFQQERVEIDAMQKELMQHPEYSSDSKFYDFMLEKDKNGNRTGNIIREISPEYNSDFLAASTEIWNSKEVQSKKTHESKIEAYNKLREDWIKENKNNYKDPRYKEIESLIKSGDVKGKFYKFFIEKMDQYNDGIPPYLNRDYKLPQIMKDQLQRYLEGGTKSLKKSLREVKRGVRDAFKYNEGDEETFRQIEKGQPGIPLFYSQELKDKSEMSYDLPSLLQAWAYSTGNYKNSMAVADEVEVFKDVIDKRAYYKNSRIANVFSGDKAQVRDKVVGESKIQSQVRELVEGLLYGKIYEGQTKQILGKKINMEKTARILNKYASRRNMMLNPTSSVLNSAAGTVSNFIEAMGGEYYNIKHLAKAHKIYNAALINGGLLSDIGKSQKKSKINIVSELLGIDEVSHFNANSLKDKSAARKLLNIDTLYATSSVPEHMIQNKMMLSFLLATKPLDKNGNTIKGVNNMWDAISVENGKVSVNAKVQKFQYGSTGNKITRDFSINDLKNVNRQIINRAHGNYTQETLTAANRHWWGMMGLLHKKFMVEGYKKRFQGERFNETLGNYEEGFYVTYAKFIKNLVTDLSKAQFNIMAHWGEMKPNQRANIKRGFGEMLMMAFTYLIGGALLDEDDEPYNTFAYLSIRRMQKELALYVNPANAVRVTKSGAASTFIISDGIKTLNQLLDPTEEYKSGIRKGKNKLLDNVYSLLPFPARRLQTDITNFEDANKARLQFLENAFFN